MTHSSALGVSRHVIGGSGLKANRRVTPVLHFSLVFCLLGLSSLALSGCKAGGGNGGNGGVNGNLPSVAGISVTPGPAFMAVGGKLQFNATPQDSSGKIVNGLTVTWSSSAANVATINSNGLATGVATGTTQISASVNNGAAAFSAKLTVNPALAMNSVPLPLGALTFPYNTNGLINAGMRRGGVGPFTWSLAGGTVLPAGLTLNANGSISGTPTLAGTPPSFTVQVIDSENPPVSKQAQLSLTVVDPNSPCSAISGGNEPILNGSYALLLQGFQGSTSTANGTPVAMAGSFTADGHGNIAAGGEEDMNLASGPKHLTTISGGSYRVSTSGQGCVQLKYVGGAASVFHFALSLSLNGSNIATHGRIIEFDGYQGSQGGPATKLASGVMLLQDPTQFHLANLASRYAFGEDGVDSNGGHVAVAGSFAVDTTTGNISNLAEDVDDAGITNTFTGQNGTIATTSTTTTTGRTLTTINITGAGAFHTATYIVNMNEVFIVSIDPLGTSTPIFSGRAILTASAFNSNALSSNFIFHATGIDRQGDGATCAASGPCAAIQMGVVTGSVSNPGTGILTGSAFFSQAGATQSNPINLTFAVNSTTGRVALTGGQHAPVLYLATPLSATSADPTEPINAFIAGSNGDPLAFFGFAEAQAAGPYSLNSPPPYIFGTEDGGEFDANFVAGNGAFASGVFTATRDVSNADGLFNAAVANPLTLSINSDGTISSSSADGVTNGTSVKPGRAFWCPPMNLPPFIRASEP